MYQTGLFGPEDGPLLEKDVQDLIDEINPYLWAAIVNPFDDLTQRRAVDQAFQILNEGESAQFLRPQIIRHAKNIFENNDAMDVRAAV